jgi:GTP-binding protein LepA
VICAQGIGIHEILEAVVQRIPPPQETLQQPLRALIFDSYYDPYKAQAAAVQMK